MQRHKPPEGTGSPPQRSLRSQARRSPWAEEGGGVSEFPATERAGGGGDLLGQRNGVRGGLGVCGILDYVHVLHLESGVSDDARRGADGVQPGEQDAPAVRVLRRRGWAVLADCVHSGGVL